MSATREQRRLLYEQLLGEQVVGKYTLTSLLGFGGMGAVYEAIQSPMGRKVALKIIPTHDPTTAARFEREAYTISKLRHPNTVTVFDFGQTDNGQLFLSMEHLDGHTLTHLIRSVGPLPYPRAVHITEQMCRALGEAHRMGVMHRDIKPDNIFLVQVDQDPDYVKVLDFGIAKALHNNEDVSLTAEGRIVGTPRYMAPEQVLAQPTDHRADIYSLGCLLMEMLTGLAPFEHQGATKLMISHAQDPPPRFVERLTSQQFQHIPPALEELVRMTLAKSPDDRPQTTDALRRMMSEATNIPMAFPSTGSVIPKLNANHVAHIKTAGLDSNPTGNHTIEHHTGDFSHETSGYAADSDKVTPPYSGGQEEQKSKNLLSAALMCTIVLVVSVFILSTKQDSNAPPLPHHVAETKHKTATSKKQTHTTQNTMNNTIQKVTHKRYAPTPQPSQISFELTSKPRGATILHQGREVGFTPMTLSLDATAAKTTYHLRLAHHALKALEVDPKSPKTTYFAVLKKQPPKDQSTKGKSSKKNRTKKKRTKKKYPRNTEHKKTKPNIHKLGSDEDANIHKIND